MTQPDGTHTIPVPRGMSVEQAWENGHVVRVIPPAEIDLLAELTELYRRVEGCLVHPRTAQMDYDYVWVGLEDAKRGLRDALDGWPA